MGKESDDLRVRVNELSQKIDMLDSYIQEFVEAVSMMFHGLRFIIIENQNLGNLSESTYDNRFPYSYFDEFTVIPSMKKSD